MSVRVARAVAGDAEAIARAFEAEGWAKPREQLERYLAEQDAGLRTLLVARDGDAVAGYVTLSWDPDYPPFRESSIPEIQDLNVLPSFRRRGIATRLLDVAEHEAATRSARVGLGVGLYSAYGPAQRLYARRGYRPDGAGATWGALPLHGGETVSVDDRLVLHMVKELNG